MRVNLRHTPGQVCDLVAEIPPDDVLSTTFYLAVPPGEVGAICDICAPAAAARLGWDISKLRRAVPAKRPDSTDGAAS